MKKSYPKTQKVGGKKGGRDIFSEKVGISASGFIFIVKIFAVMATMSVL
jgi:hypothetical protein